ncbi:phospholipase A I [Gossypium raimondii]|nr:phospholipase A I [Gossypium raimondii]
MSWGLGWKRPSEIFRLSLYYGYEESREDLDRTSSQLIGSCSSSSASLTPPQDQQEPGFKIDLDWVSGDDVDQVALRLQSQLMLALPSSQDTVAIELKETEENVVRVEMYVEKRREPLRAVTVVKATGSSQQSDGVGVLLRLLRSNLVPSVDADPVANDDHWKGITSLSLCGCGLTTLPVELTQLPILEKLYLDYNKLSQLPPELGDVKNLKVLRADCNMLLSVPVELKQCIGLVELSLEHNKIVRLLLDFRATIELEILRLFGNPLEFLPEILPLRKLSQLSLANIRIVADENLRSVTVQIEMENSSYFGTSKHKLSAFFSLIFRFSSCHHPLIASALTKIIMQDQGNCVLIGKDENALRQLISMISSDNRHVVSQACSALSTLAGDVSVAMELMKCDIMKPIEFVMKSIAPEEQVSVLQVVGTLAFGSDIVAQKMLSRDVLRSLKILCANKNPEVQRLALLAVGNLAFCLENRFILVTSESLRELLMRLTFTSEPRVNKAAARALAILGENENLRRAIRGRQVPKRGLRILSMDGGGMKGLATVQMLKEIEKGTGKRIHELFDLVCGTSTGGMLAVALGIKLMTLDQCEEIYKKLGKLVFTEPVPKDEAATWREKFDQLYKSSSQSIRVAVHGSKHSADQFERLLKEMCADEDGDLLIDSAVKNIPKVFVVSTLVSVMPAQPFLFRNYQYSVGTPEVPLAILEGSVTTIQGAQFGYKRNAFIGSCKHHVWKAIRASSAAPYYLDDFSDDVNRWQDGAIVANNPTLFSIREAQLLWPDTKIDCLVSIGSGSVPTKARKGGWRYLDTGQVLIESSCSVERAEEALSAMLTMLPEIQYFRFNPVDERCDMELDETDPTVWLKLEASVKDYIQNNSDAFKNACERLLVPFARDEKWTEKFKSQHFARAKASNAVLDENTPSLGWRRNVLLVEALSSPDSGRIVHHAQALESFCVQNGIRLTLLHDISGVSKTVPTTTFPTPFTSPLLAGSFPSNSLSFIPIDLQRLGQIDKISPFSLDGLLSGKKTTSQPKSPTGPRELSLPVQSLHEKLQNLPQVGIIHLALQNDSVGSILSWQNEVFVVAEPGELADRFLQSVKVSMLSMMRSRNRKGASPFAQVTTIADLIRCRPYFQVGNIGHRYIGRQTQVTEDDQEIGAYMFRRTVPSLHIKPDDVRWMVGAWRDRIIIFTGTYGPSANLIKAFLDSGAKAVLCPTAEPQDVLINDLGEYNVLGKGRFEIGDEDPEDEDSETETETETESELETISPSSDWDDHDMEKNTDHGTSFWDKEEDELSRFVCKLYDSIFREGATVDVALKNSLACHRKLRYTCHLPYLK